MYTDDFINLLFEKFANIPNEKNETLVMALFRDLDKEYLWDDKHLLIEYLSHHKILSTHFTYIKKNIKNNRFIEPFNDWFDIPNWYLSDLSYEGLVFTTPIKRNFYTPKFILQSITNTFYRSSTIGELSFFAWKNHFLPTFVNGLDYPKSEYFDDFTRLTDEQKSIIAFFLCHQVKEQKLLLNKPDKEQYPFFYQYWKDYLPILFSDKIPYDWV